jgi:pimeloyl-ACP methyl ester carboxylesterase
VQPVASVAGSGDPILFIHGLGGGAQVFAPQVAALSVQRRCIAFDLPGAARSPLNGAVTIDTLVEAALSVADRHAAGQAVHVIAHSMGTVVAQHLALAAPTRIRSLGLIGPIHTPADATREALRARAARARSEGLAGIADDIAVGALSAHTQSDKPDVAAAVRQSILEQTPEGYAQHCEALAAAQAANLSAISAPALLMTGDEDRTAAPDAVRAMHHGLPGSQLTLLAACGHWATLEQPSEVSALVAAFLDAVC